MDSISCLVLTDLSYSYYSLVIYCYVLLIYITYMSFNDLEQKAKGIAQQIKGAVEEKTGRPIKGAADKIAGKAKAAAADASAKAKEPDKIM